MEYQRVGQGKREGEEGEKGSLLGTGDGCQEAYVLRGLQDDSWRTGAVSNRLRGEARRTGDGREGDAERREITLPNRELMLRGLRHWHS